MFHLAAEPGVRPSWGTRFESYVRNNVLATQHLLEAVRHARLHRFVYASSSSIYGQTTEAATPEEARPQPHSPYGVTKLAGEQLCDAYSANFGVPSVALRYFTVYGPKQRPDMAFHRFCKAAIDRSPIQLFGDGLQTREFTYVHDVVPAATRAAGAMDLGDRTYNIGGGSQSSVIDAIALIEELTDSRLDIRYLPAEPGDVRDTRADTTRARVDLKYAPFTGLREGLEAELTWIADVAGHV